MKYIKKEQILQWVLIGGGVIALIVSLFFDTAINKKLSGLNYPILSAMSIVLSNLYLIILVLFIYTTFAMYIGKKREGILPLWASLIITIVLGVLLKLLVARERPLDVNDFAFFTYAFPSLHAAICFCVVPILDVEFPRLKWFWIGLGVLVGLSRLFLQVHYLSDVIAGILIGYIIGLVVWYMNQKFFYKIKW